MPTLIYFLAQMENPTDGTPLLTSETSHAMTWMIVGVLSIGILLVAFKTSKRNHLERD
jgi:hypothetical protein